MHGRPPGSRSGRRHHEGLLSSRQVGGVGKPGAEAPHLTALDPYAHDDHTAPLCCLDHLPNECPVWDITASSGGVFGCQGLAPILSARLPPPAIGTRTQR
jgi:hypothetical protein